MTSAVQPAKPQASWRDDLIGAARTLSVLTLVGGACGAFVVGILGRLAMALLAALNPDATGVKSDDGFVMGQFTLSGSAQLALAGLQFGVVGAGCYVVVRGLIIGPSWFRLLSISLGPAVVIGAIVVHTDGVDFQFLEPVWLATGLFIALPAAYVTLLHVLGERALERWRPPNALVGLGFAPWVLLFPVTLALAAGFAAFRTLRRHDTGRAFLARAWPAWILRAGLVVLFVAALVDLRNDLVDLS